MREEFPGYYRHTDEERAELWKTAVVVPDANVLLTLYRLGEATQEKMLAIFRGLGERLFVPHQAALEFQCNRLAVIDDQLKAYDDLDKELEKLSTTVFQKLRRHPRLDREELRDQVTGALAPIREEIATLNEAHPDPLLDGHPLGEDSVRDALAEVLDDRIGARRDPAELAKVGAPRYKRKQAPGWKDAEKPVPECYGDLAIWLDAVERAKAESKPLIFVTEERKEDWWWERGGELIGPRPELVEEVRSEAGQDFYLANLTQFMEEGAVALELEFSEAEREDVRRARRLEVRRGPSPLPRWFSGGQSEPERATLSLWLHPRPPTSPETWPPMLITCRVECPDGTNVEFGVLTDTFSVDFVYPESFTESAVAEPGVYSYSWSCTWKSADLFEIPSGNVASGTFEIPADKPPHGRAK
jgi:hypothetical protein